MLIKILSQVFFHNACKYFKEALLKAFKWNNDLISALWNRKQMQVTTVVEGKNCRVRLGTNGPYNKALHSMYKGDVFLHILEVILFNTLMSF